MSDCCTSNSPKTMPTTQACPQCSVTCKPVAMRTLYHQVKFPQNQEIVIGDYYFCSSKACTTAYFSSTGNSIPKQHLVTYEDLQNDKLCYCFDIDAADYHAALNSNQADAIKNFVIEKTKSDECACEFRNPSGHCCLAKIKQLHEHLTHNC